MDAIDGFIYIFNIDKTFRKTASDGTLQEAGIYRLDGREEFFEFEFEGEEIIQGYSFEFTTNNTITLSPSFPGICIEGCFYRFNRR